MQDPASVWLLAQLLVALVITNRYVFGPLLLRLTRRAQMREEPVPQALPTVTIVVPLFNEGASIYHTIGSLLKQRYPADKLDVVVIDDCSTDDSASWAERAATESERVSVIRSERNQGKRMAIAQAVRHARGEYIVSVDSDVIVAPDAVLKLIACFGAPNLVAVGGRVRVLNANANWLTRMQAIKYFFGYEYMKSLERACQRVMCLSGCLTAYRKEVLLELEPVLAKRALCGVPIKYGEDRFLTRQIIRAGYATSLTLDAVCWTKAPETLGGYFAQQLRWRRSNIVDYLGGLSHVWRVNPLISLHYFSLASLLVLYPMVLVYALMRGTFFETAAMHLAVLTMMGAYHGWMTRREPAEQRVHPLSFCAMALVMPVTYVVLTPLALMTLDSGSWETRNHQAPAKKPARTAAKHLGARPVRPRSLRLKALASS